MILSLSLSIYIYIYKGGPGPGAFVATSSFWGANDCRTGPPFLKPPKCGSNGAPKVPQRSPPGLQNGARSDLGDTPGAKRTTSTLVGYLPAPEHLGGSDWGPEWLPEATSKWHRFVARTETRKMLPTGSERGPKMDPKVLQKRQNGSTSTPRRKKVDIEFTLLFTGSGAPRGAPQQASKQHVEGREFAGRALTTICGTSSSPR